MRRRAFIGALFAGAAGLALDPEQLLWRPGAKSIFLPPAKPSLWASERLMRGDVFTIQGVYAVNPRTYRELPFLQQFVITANVSSNHPVQFDQIVPTPVFDGMYKNASGIIAPRSRVELIGVAA